MVQGSSNPLWRALHTAATMFILSSLSGCLITDKPVFTLEDAQDVPGGTGAWDLIEHSGVTNEQLFVRKLADGSFAFELSRTTLKAIAVHLHGGYYVIQVPSDEKKPDERYLILIQVLPDYLVTYSFSDEKTLGPLAEQFGLDFSSGRTNGADKRKIRAFFDELITDADDEAKVTVYARAGYFTDKGREDLDEKAEQKLKAGDYAGALPALEFRAARGDRAVQLRLAEIYGTQFQNSYRAIESATQAFASGNTEAALTIAKLYSEGTPMRQVGLALPDYEKALEWTGAAWVNKTRPAETEKTMNAYAASYCSTPELKAAHPDTQECAQTVLTHFLERAKRNQDSISTAQALVANVLARWAIEDKADKARQNVEKFEREAKRIKHEICAVTPHDPRCSAQ